MSRRPTDGHDRLVPAASSPEALERMHRQRRTGTKPEVELRRLLHARRLRYRVDAPLPVPGRRRRADVLFSAAKVAVFVDGCFWHSCPIHATKPKANAEWWASKLATNVARDRDTDRRMVEIGWTVVRIWEHEDPVGAADKVYRIVHGQSARSSMSPSADSSSSSMS